MFREAVRVVGGTAAVVTGGWALRALQGAPAALGASPVEINPVVKGSPNYHDGVFRNIEPGSDASLTRQDQWRLLQQVLAGGTDQRPSAPVPLVTPADALPAIDAVIISHDHYDHLDVDTVKHLARTQRAKFFVPLGIGAHLRAWHIPDDRIVELDWNEAAQLGELSLVCTPARHFSGRFLSRNVTLWSSWAIIGPRHRAFFGGDTGYTKSFADIGADHGPFDVTLMPIGAYHPGWPDIHMNPEDAVRAHRDVTDAGLLVPIHWATFRLAPHPWSEPVERMLTAAAAEGVQVATPRPGQRVDATE